VNQSVLHPATTERRIYRCFFVQSKKEAKIERRDQTFLICR